jgi:hypothetical protein
MVCRGRSIPATRSSASSFFADSFQLRGGGRRLKAPCSSAYVKYQLPDCAAPSSERFRRGILGGLFPRDYGRGCGWWYTTQRLLTAREKSPARRDKRDVLYNVLVVPTEYLLPVLNSGEEVHGLGLKPCFFRPEPCSFWAGTRLAIRVP